MTEKVPFEEYNNHAVTPKIVAGVRPRRPTDAAEIGFSDSLWQLAEDSWKQDPKERCTIEVALEQVNLITRYWDPLTRAGARLQQDSGPDSDQTVTFYDMGTYLPRSF